GMRSKHSRRPGGPYSLAWPSIFLIGCLSCGGGDGGGASGGDGGSGGTAASGGSGGSASTSSGGGSGGGAGTGGRPAIPPPPLPASCSSLDMSYDGGDCSTACSNVRCECDPFPASYLGCHQELGCLSSVDCEVACDWDLGDV